MIRIACVGDNCVDYYDNTNEAFPGGNPVNVAVYVCRLGGKSSYLGAVGNDANGEMLCAAVKAKGVDTSHVQVLPGATALTHVCRIDGERVFGDYEEGVMADFVLRDETGIMFLDYNQPLWIINKVFALFKSPQYFNKKVTVYGWYRRNIVPFFELYSMEIDGQVKKCYSYGFGWAWRIILLAIAALAVVGSFVLYVSQRKANASLICMARLVGAPCSAYKALRRGRGTRQSSASISPKP